MRPGLVSALASALFKSYLRSSRNASVSFFSRPRVMLVVNASLFVVPALIVQYIVGFLTVDIVALLLPLLLQAIISLPVLMTFATIVAGLMFELGQGSAISSSEAVNWLPVSPREYVAASSLSLSLLYSFFLALAAGITLPLTLSFGLFYLWPVMILLSIVSLLLGAFVIEFLRAIVNRVSSTVYKKRGRLAIAMRLLALVIIFSIVQLAFQPAVLYWVLGEIVGGVEVAWIVPFVWPSLAMLSLASHDFLGALAFVSFSMFFALVAYETASQLRRRYWSPIPVSISLGGAKGYVPKASAGFGFGLSPLASVLAMKEFRALIRRKELSRFLAIPVVISVGFLAPFVASPGGGRAPGFFLTLLISFLTPFMFSSISIGQEGTAIMNLVSFPISTVDLIKGKLVPTWLISLLTTFGLIGILEILAPMGLSEAVATFVVAGLAIFMNSFIGLAIAARWPDYTVGTRSRYVTLTGFMVGFLFAGLSTLAVFAPVGLYLITSGGVLGPIPVFRVDFLSMLALSIVIGSVLTVISYLFCKKGIQELLSNI